MKRLVLDTLRMKCLYKYPNEDIEAVFISNNLELEANIDSRQLMNIMQLWFKLKLTIKGEK